MKVYDAVANAFVKEGTTAVFGVLGDGQLPWWQAMSQKPGVKIINAREEGASLSMADGWARVTGKVGVCGVTHGPGVARLANSLVMSSRSHTPIVVYTSKTPFHNEANTQYIDQDRLVTATGAGYIEVLKPDFAEEAVRTAFYRARIEARPFVLSVPRDVHKQDCEVEDEYVPSWALFKGQQKIQPDAERLSEAVQMLLDSRKPVIVLGRGAVTPEAVATAERLATRTGALVATTLLAKGTLSEYEYHAGIAGLFSTRSVMELLEHADCVLALGAALNERTLEGGYLFPNAKIIHVNVAQHLRMGTRKSADCYLQGDAGVTVQAIDAMLEKKGHKQTGYHTPDVKKVLRDAWRDPREFEIEPGTVDTREALRVIDEKMPADISLVTGSGHAFSITGMVMRKPRPHLVVTNAEWGSIGQVTGTAIGAAVGLEGKPLLHIEGDGSMMQNIQELDTAGRLKLKILFAIINDEAFGAEYHKLKPEGKDTSISLNPAPDFVAVAKGFRCRGRQAKTLDEVAVGVEEFLAGAGPMLLDIRVSRNVISIPYRRLNYGEDA